VLTRREMLEAVTEPTKFFATMPPILHGHNYFTFPAAYLPDEILTALGWGVAIHGQVDKRSVSVLIHRESLTYFGFVWFQESDREDGMPTRMHTTTFFWAKGFSARSSGREGYQILDVLSRHLEGAYGLENLTSTYVDNYELPDPDRLLPPVVSLASTCVNCGEGVERLSIPIGPRDAYEDPNSRSRRTSFHIDLHGDPRFDRPDGDTSLHPLYCAHNGTVGRERDVPFGRRRPGAVVGACATCRETLLWSPNMEYALHDDTGAVFCKALPHPWTTVTPRPTFTPAAF
jgi:hypothetical protein